MMKAGQTVQLLALIWSLWAALGCATPPKPLAEEKKMESVAPAGEITVNEGAVGTIGDCRIGLQSVTEADGGAFASVALMRQGVKEVHRNDYVARTPAKRGALLPICGQLYRVTEVTAAPSGQRGSLKIDTQPVSVPSVTLRRDSFVIPLNHTSELHGLEIEIARIEDKKAQLSLWPNDYEKRNATIKTVTVAVGNELDLNGYKHRVLAVVAPIPAQGVGGWLEIEFAPVK
jgi:hypothetical protein